MADPMYEKIGAAIRSRRETLGLSQAKLASRAGMVRTSLTMIENGAQGILVHQLLTLAAALRLSPAELLAPAMVRAEQEPESSTRGEAEQLLSELSRPVNRITR
jgi:transcriptional regulator with XRE-family HTH domain